MRKAVVVAWLIGIFSVIACLFWYNEWVYALPTPIPVNYVAVKPGALIALPAALQFPDDRLKTGSKRPLLLHFFNPDCPCSRFNIPQFKSLVKQYSDRVDFAVVLLSSKEYSPQQIRKRFGLDLPVLSDTSAAAKAAIACGVYSTPQAVLLTGDHALFYRGNYNRSRYCADPATNYASQALEALLHQQHGIIFDPLALRSYGCRLPNCSQ
ncbi:MAG: hypothetical protein P4L51_02705 [Puia sp.]|nr:hypothetical protein [Puia sp.]